MPASDDDDDDFNALWSLHDGVKPQQKNPIKGKRRSLRQRGEEAPSLPTPSPPKLKLRRKASKLVTKPVTEPVTPPPKKKTAKKGRKKANTDQPTSPDPLRCCICMKWHTPPLEEVYAGAIWTCDTCRTIPETLADIQKQLATTLQTNIDLVSSLAGKIGELEEVRKENIELRHMLNLSNQTLERNPRHLIISDFAFNNITATEPDKLEIAQNQEMTLDKAIKVLSDQSSQSYGKITLVIGANDCDGESSISNMSHKLTTALQLAKTLVKKGDVKVSSILPRLNNTKVQNRIDEMNSAAESICKELNIEFIPNISFRLGDGEINDGFLTNDGKHLNQAGCSHLVKNLQLQHQVAVSSHQPWNTVHGKKTKPAVAAHEPKPNVNASKHVTKQQKAPCFNCGIYNHTSNNCRFKKRVTCYSCGGQGHKSNKSNICNVH